MSTTRQFRHFFLITIILLSYSILSAQIRIKERVEISPSARIMAEANSGSVGLDTLIDYIDSAPGSAYTRVYVVRTSVFTVSSSIQSSEEIPVGVILNANTIITNSSGEVTVYCECENCGKSFPIFLYDFSNQYTKMTIEGVSVTTDARTANITLQGLYTYTYVPRSVPFTAVIELEAVAYHEPVIEQIIMDGNPILDATGINNALHLGLRASSIASTGGNFLMCARSVPATFTIENPLEGLKLIHTRNDGSTVEDDISIEAEHRNGSDGWTSVKFEWDGKKLPNSEDTTITVSVSRFGLSDTCKIKLIKMLPDHFSIEPESTMVSAGDTITIRATASTAEGQEETQLNGQTQVTFYAKDGGSFIIGSGTYEDSITVTYDVARSGTIKYLDYYGILWTGMEPINARLEVWRTDRPVLRGDTTIQAMPLCEVVEITPEEISPGDTSYISLMMKKPDGTLVEYESGQLFDIWMDMEEEYGGLRCISSEEEGTYLTGPQPFEFIAADSLAVDSSIVVRIEAWTSYGGGGASSIAANDTLQIPAKLMLKVQAGKGEKGTINSTRTAVIERNTSRSVEKLLKRLYAVREKAKDKSRFDKIIAKIETQYSGKNGLTTNTDVAQKSLAKSGVSMSVEEGEFCELPVAIVTIKNEPELVVVYPTDNLMEQKNIEGTNPPTMPKLTIKAQLKNYDKEVNFYITFTKLRWTAPGTTPQRITTGYFEGNKAGSGEVEIHFTLPNNYIRGGDDMTIDVRAVAGGKTYIKILTNPFKIQGLNPSRATLYAVLGEDIYAAVAWQESSFRQFDGSPGFPLQGGDHNDIGIMGLRGPNLNDDRIWNWLSNVQFGKNYFINTCMHRAANYTTIEDFSEYDPKPTSLNNDIHNTDKNQNQVFLQAYCYYNAGPYSHVMYWKWIPADIEKGINGKWKENTESGSQAPNNANRVWNWFISKPWNN